MASGGEAVARIAGGPAGWISVLIPAALFAWFAQFLGPVAGGSSALIGIEWVPSLGVRLEMLIDGLSLTFALLITGIGTLVTLYSIRYLGAHPEYPRFVLYLMIFMVGMLGLTLADNLIALFVFWEVTTISSYLLIGFNSDSAKSRRSALQALLLTGTGGLALLAGAVLLGTAAGTYSLSEIRSMEGAIRDHALYLPILILFLAGAFTKSAQFPFHFWLPNAMAAPTPVSAYLHSATMVKGGVYLMARMNPTLGGTEPWFWALVIAGGFTTVFASVLAIRQTDIKQILAYTTLMALGALTLFIGAGSSAAIKAAMLFLVVHSLYKAGLFLMIGIVDMQTGTREVAQLRGLARKMPITFFAGALAAISMAGIPPFVGFIGKEFLYDAGLEAETASLWITGTIFAASVLMFVAAGIAVARPFLGRLPEKFQEVTEGPMAMWLGPVILGAFSLFFGVFADVPEVWLVGPATQAVYGSAVEVDLYLFHGVNAAFILSLVTFGVGFVLYLLHGRLREMLARVISANPIKFDPGWDRSLDGLKALASWQTRYLQSGILQRYIFVTFATFALAVGATLYLKEAMNFGVDFEAEFDGLQFKHWAVLLFITAGALLTALTQSRMTAIASLGVVGIGVALIFIMFSAPDVAITQLLVETLVVVLVAVAMLKLPHLRPRTQERHRPIHAVLSVVVGVLTTLVLVAVLQTDLDLSLTAYFNETSWPEAYGRNVVNVILVDFRAVDTFGEIAVIVVAALSAYALLRGTRYGTIREETEPPRRDTTVIEDAPAPARVSPEESRP
ncbi:putative monovalent cation/H+ antiporter subunit A [Gymnodinialimonas ceratoperidinii]|uniref:Monovalent cation/H+ antiporter subunit A n=1 Tax=Gymnodinialimonas ceratoperidinii TaxID=2856823 RepID=A0A8F6TVE7_9RHOB|nr:putative monovalent cation/H+ antiporter subunit A [Gymnodinialimonas ceratoperidinii]QXT39410.1 putative monovalent cation/H+ antiporter subunit A [Gymnodinialimonas ceratoperidinii]